MMLWVALCANNAFGLYAQEMQVRKATGDLSRFKLLAIDFFADNPPAFGRETEVLFSPPIQLFASNETVLLTKPTQGRFRRSDLQVLEKQLVNNFDHGDVVFVDVF